MIQNLKYFAGLILTIPLLPLLFVHGKRIRKSVPKLPEAKNPVGLIEKNNERMLRIIALGESTFAGVGIKYHKDGFISSLAKEIAHEKNTNINWRIYAKSGYTAKKVHEKLIAKIEENSADLIIIGLGGNDAFTLNSPMKWKKDINHLIDKLRKKFPDTSIYFTNMPPIKDFPAFTKPIKLVIGNLVELLGSTLREAVKNKPNVYYSSEIIRLSEWQNEYNIKGDASTFFSDGVHPSAITYQTWGKDMASFILKTDNLNL